MRVSGLQRLEPRILLRFELLHGRVVERLGADDCLMPHAEVFDLDFGPLGGILHRQITI